MTDQIRPAIPVELGLAACIIGNSHGLILHNQIMQNYRLPSSRAADSDCPCQIPGLNACSFD